MKKIEWYQEKNYFEDLYFKNDVVFFPHRYTFDESYNDFKYFKTFNRFKEFIKGEYPNLPKIIYHLCEDTRKGFNKGYWIILFNEEMTEWWTVGQIVEYQDLYKPTIGLEEIWKKIKKAR